MTMDNILESPLSQANDKPPNTLSHTSNINQSVPLLNGSTHALKDVFHHQQIPRSSSPSTRSTTSVTTNASSRYYHHKFSGKHPISDIPVLIDLCHEFLKNRNVTGLAMIARQSGLPPSLRYKIWPILLKYHPLVLNPYIDIDEDVMNAMDEDENGQYKIPIKDIKYDLRKYLRNSDRYRPKVFTSELKDLYEIQDKMFEIIEYSIIKFLKKWGSIVHYNSSIAWIALNLAEWVPPIQDSHFVLCGRDDVAKNGTKLRNVNESYFERLNYTLSSESNSMYETPSDILSPQLSTPTASPPSTPPSGFKPMSFSEVFERLVLVILHTPDPDSIPHDMKFDVGTNDHMKYSTLIQYGGSIEDRISFFLHGLRKLMPQVHRHLSEEGCLDGSWLNWWLKYDGAKLWSRYDRGRTWDLILGWRPDCKGLESELKPLNSLSDSSLSLIGEDIFWNPINLTDSKMDRQHIVNSEVFENDDDDDEDDGNHTNKNGRSTSVLTILSRTHSMSHSLEKTPTLTSSTLCSPPLLASLASSQFHIRSPDSTVLTPTVTITSGDDINSIRSPSTTTPKLSALEEIEPLQNLPFSIVHPHVEMIFVSLAFLKSKEFAIMELDKSEIISLLERWSSLTRSDIGTTDDENFSLNNIHTSSSSSPTGSLDYSQTNQLSDGNLNSMSDLEMASTNGMESAIGDVRKSVRDIENVLVEAGELWRKFLYIDMMEDT